LGERSAAAVEKKFQKFKFKAGFETAEKVSDYFYPSTLLPLMISACIE
jgi:hypothetical protein